MEKEKTFNKKQRIYLIVGIVLFLILILSATYAYFAITSINNATPTTITGNGEALGTPTLTTNTTSLNLTLTSELMSKANAYKFLFATTTDTPVITTNIQENNPDITLNNGRYVLATASLFGGDVSYNCSYNFDISATVDKTITDSSDQDVYVTITTPKGETVRFTLAQLLEESKTISGVINNLSAGEDQQFLIDSFIYNHSLYSQDDLAGNSYSIKVTPKSGTNGFNCSAVTEPTVTGIAKTLIDSGKLIQTGFEGDGYRFTGGGIGEFCSYDNGKYVISTYGEPCDTLYNRTRTNNTTGKVSKYYYESSCKESTTSSYTTTCETLTPVVVTNQDPSNYVCFGTTSKSTCTSNPNKYMYRAIGVFPDEYGNEHVKLIKNTTIGSYAWNSVSVPVLAWGKSDLFKGLNGSYFLTNSSYDYMQNNTWKNKITDWKWVSANRGMTTRGNGNDMTLTNIYSYDENTNMETIYKIDMNRSNKPSAIGMWSYATAKIGLINNSDYKLAHPAALIVGNKQVIYNNWLTTIPENDDFEWTINPISIMARALQVENTTGYYTDATLVDGSIVRPAFYLNSNVEISSGTGTSSDPYILK